MKKESLIFRSDSKGEDLQNYAGAGLYDRLVFSFLVHYFFFYPNVKQPSMSLSNSIFGDYRFDPFYNCNVQDWICYECKY